MVEFATEKKKITEFGNFLQSKVGKVVKITKKPAFMKSEWS
ncbi:hypothetical protein JCM19238_2256 [Vibrio ponticus]|nr:hypothetical protein JCM19238_2256 [Vibrio ponticus]